MNIYEMRQAVCDAKKTILGADEQVKDIAILIAGRLRCSRVPHDVLAKLKRELRDYDMRDGTWKDES